MGITANTSCPLSARAAEGALRQTRGADLRAPRISRAALGSALAGLLGLAMTTACASNATQPAPARAPTPLATREPAVVTPDPVAEDAGAGVLRGSGESEYLGVIDRAGLTEIVDQGLGRLLGRLQLSPELEGKRFRGFRVAALDPQWSGSGVLTGDIITRLNGQPIERPEQAMVAFDSLRVASEVAVEIVRDGKPLRLRYRVE